MKYFRVSKLSKYCHNYSLNNSEAKKKIHTFVFIIYWFANFFNVFHLRAKNRFLAWKAIFHMFCTQIQKIL